MLTVNADWLRPVVMAFYQIKKVLLAPAGQKTMLCHSRGAEMNSNHPPSSPEQITEWEELQRDLWLSPEVKETESSFVFPLSPPQP